MILVGRYWIDFLDIFSHSDIAKARSHMYLNVKHYF